MRNSQHCIYFHISDYWLISCRYTNTEVNWRARKERPKRRTNSDLLSYRVSLLSKLHETERGFIFSVFVPIISCRHLGAHSDIATFHISRVKFREEEYREKEAVKQRKREEKEFEKEERERILEAIRETVRPSPFFI